MYEQASLSRRGELRWLEATLRIARKRRSNSR
jgi:hypothetical protein